MSFGSLATLPKQKEEPKKAAPEVEEDNSAAEVEAASAELSSVMDQLGDKMADWSEKAKPQKPKSKGTRPNPVAKNLDALRDTIVNVAAGQTEIGLEFNAAKAQQDKAVAEKAAEDVTGAISKLSQEVAKAAEKKPELTEAVRVIGEVLGKRIEAASMRTADAVKASQSDPKPLVGAIEALTKKIEQIVADNSNSGDAIKSLASAITNIETRLESLSKQKQVMPKPRKPVPYKFTIGRNPETNLLETAVAEPLV